MKKYLAYVFVIAAAMVSRGEQWTMSISASTRCIPAQSVATNLVTAWTNGISVAAGAYYSGSNGRTYMALDSGSSTNTPVGRLGKETGDDGVSWLSCTPSIGTKGVVACVMSGAEVNYNRNGDATTNMPWTVKNVFDPARGDWRFIPSDGGTSVVSFLEL